MWNTLKYKVLKIHGNKYCDAIVKYYYVNVSGMKG